jgi:hypothetical protein
MLKFLLNALLHIGKLELDITMTLSGLTLPQFTYTTFIRNCRMKRDKRGPINGRSFTRGLAW